MTTAAIDRDILNELFDNQKKFDDIFGSIFDDDTTIKGSSSVNSNTYASSALNTSQDDDYTYEDLSYDTEDKDLNKKNTSLVYMVLPVVAEVAVIFYGIFYFL